MTFLFSSLALFRNVELELAGQKIKCLLKPAREECVFSLRYATIRRMSMSNELCEKKDLNRFSDKSIILQRWEHSILLHKYSVRCVPIKKDLAEDLESLANTKPSLYE